MAKTLLQILLLGAMLWPGLVVPARSEAAAADDSAADFMAVRQLHPDSQEADLAAFAAARCDLAQGAEGRALVTLLNLLESDPGSPLAERARFLASDLFDRRGEIGRALQELQVLREQFPESPLAASSLQRESLLYRLRRLVRSPAGAAGAWKLDEGFAAATGGAGLKSPRSFAISADGTLWVADEKTDALVAFDAAGKAIARQPWPRPIALAADPAGGLRAAGSREAGRPGEVPIAPASGAAGKDKEPPKVRRIGTIAVAPDRRVLLIDDSESSLLRYGPSMQFEGLLYRARAGSLKGLAIDPDGRIWVGLEKTRDVVLLDPSGRELLHIRPQPVRSPGGAQGRGEEGFDSIQALATDAAGNLYVLDDQVRRIFVFDRSGTQAAAIDLAALGLEDAAPTAIAVDPAGSIYLADRRTGRIVRLR